MARYDAFLFLCPQPTRWLTRAASSVSHYRDAVPDHRQTGTRRLDARAPRVGRRGNGFVVAGYRGMATRDRSEGCISTPFQQEAYTSTPISVKPIGFGSHSMGSGSGTPGLSTPVVLTPGGASPATSAPQGAFAAPKPQYMDLDAFFKSDEGEDEDEEDEEEEEESEEEDQKPEMHVTSASSSTPQVQHVPTSHHQHAQESAVSEEYDDDDDDEEGESEDEDEDQDEDDAFLRRG